MASKLAATALLSLCATSVAQATLLKVNIPLPDEFDDQEMVGSVIKADQSTMVISLACPSPTGDLDDYECGLFPQQTLTWGPSTWKMDMAVPGDSAFTMTQDCKFFSVNGSAVCTENAGGSEANFPGSSMKVYRSVNLTVTITGGYEKYKSANPIGTAFATASGSEDPSRAVVPARPCLQLPRLVHLDLRAKLLLHRLALQLPLGLVAALELVLACLRAWD